MNTVKRTERGWAGHFIYSNRCLFRRNTLLEMDSVRVVVSTVGLMLDLSARPEIKFDRIRGDRYFETMAFHAEFDGTYWDMNVEREVKFSSPCAIAELDADDRANDMHECVVDEITELILKGELV